MKHVPFTTAFIKEVLRLSHLLDFLCPREALVDIQLPNGLVMPEGTNYVEDISGMQLSEARFKQIPVMFISLNFGVSKSLKSENLLQSQDFFHFTVKDIKYQRN